MTERYTVKLGELRLNLSNVLKKVIGEEAEIIILKNKTPFAKIVIFPESELEDVAGVQEVPNLKKAARLVTPAVNAQTVETLPEYQGTKPLQSQSDIIEAKVISMENESRRSEENRKKHSIPATVLNAPTESDI